MIRCPVISIEPIREMTELTTLDISAATIDDLEPLTKLRSLLVPLCKNLSQVQQFKELSALAFTGCVDDQEMPTLTDLNLQFQRELHPNVSVLPPGSQEFLPE